MQCVVTPQTKPKGKETCSVTTTDDQILHVDHNVARNVLLCTLPSYNPNKQPLPPPQQKQIERNKTNKQHTMTNTHIHTQTNKQDLKHKTLQDFEV